MPSAELEPGPRCASGAAFPAETDGETSEQIPSSTALLAPHRGTSLALPRGENPSLGITPCASCSTSPVLCISHQTLTQLSCLGCKPYAGLQGVMLRSRAGSTGGAESLLVRINAPRGHVCSISLNLSAASSCHAVRFALRARSRT